MKSLSIIALGVLSLSMGMVHAQSSATTTPKKPAASAKSAPAAKKVVALALHPVEEVGAGDLLGSG